MAKNNISHSLIQRIFVLLLVTTSFVISTTAESKQQGVFLDAKGNPIPNDVLLALTGKKAKPSSVVRLPSKNNTVPKNKVTNKKKLQFNPELERELFQALKAGNTARADQLLKHGIRAVYKNYKGETPLGIAVSRGWASMVIRLLKNGADINEKGTRGVTLLHTASSRGLTDVAKVLVKHGLDPTKKTDKNWTPLHVAARYGHWQSVQYFLQVGVDPNIRNSDGKTALGLARHLRHMGVVKILSQVTTVRSLDISRKKSRKRKKRRKSKK